MRWREVELIYVRSLHRLSRRHDLSRPGQQQRFWLWLISCEGDVVIPIYDDPAPFAPRGSFEMTPLVSAKLPSSLQESYRFYYGSYRVASALMTLTALLLLLLLETAIPSDQSNDTSLVVREDILWRELTSVVACSILPLLRLTFHGRSSRGND